jgi:hypothetical protein
MIGDGLRLYEPIDSERGWTRGVFLNRIKLQAKGEKCLNNIKAMPFCGGYWG